MEKNPELGCLYEKEEHRNFLERDLGELQDIFDKEVVPPKITKACKRVV